MQENLRQSQIINFLKQIWPYIYRLLNAVFYYIMGIIKYFFKNAIKMIKGDY